MKCLIFVFVFFTFFNSFGFCQDRKDVRMNDEYFNYSECKQSIIDQKIEDAKKCVIIYGMFDTCSYTSKELQTEIDTYCGTDPAPRKQEEVK